MIAVGIVAALLMNGLVFPRHCRVYVLSLIILTSLTMIRKVLFISDASRTLGLLSQLYMTLSQ